MVVLAFLPLLQPSVTDINLRGWTIHVETAIIRDQPKVWESARQEMDNQLYRITRVVPDGPLAKLKQIPLWMNWNTKTPCAAFHPAADWLKANGMNPAMAGGVEIGNVRNFISWTYEQPWMVLHELSHAYHFTFLPKGFDNPEVAEAYKAAMASKKYESVLHWNGTNAKHYATTNPMEFFAEATEAYFGQNDFFPFTNPELKTFDPPTFQLLRTIWGDPQKRQ